MVLRRLAEAHHRGQDVGKKFRLALVGASPSPSPLLEQTGQHESPSIPQGFVAIEPDRNGHLISVTDEGVILLVEPRNLALRGEALLPPEGVCALRW